MRRYNNFSAWQPIVCINNYKTKIPLFIINYIIFNVSYFSIIGMDMISFGPDIINPHFASGYGFLAALAEGMPPAAGIAVGVDRLLMVLAGAEAIADVVAFPEE